MPEGSANDITNEHGIELICSGCDLTQLELKRQTLMRGDDEGKRRYEEYPSLVVTRASGPAQSPARLRKRCGERHSLVSFIISDGN